MSLPERSTPGWSVLDRVRPVGGIDLAHLSDDELFARYERAKRLEAMRAARIETPPDIAAEVEAMSDAELLAAFAELTR
jgi:hypothetical protein